MHRDTLFGVNGRTALVTGGATGLGRRAAEALVRNGARVIIASRKPGACEETARELSAFGECEAIQGDISSEEGVRRLAEEVTTRCDPLDILVNDAGVTWGAEFKTFPWKGWDKVLSTNVTGLFALTRDLVPLMATAPDLPARVINIGSSAGTIPYGGSAYSYAVSKAGVHHLTRILAQELDPCGITVNTIAPGPFATKITSFALERETGTRSGSRHSSASPHRSSRGHCSNNSLRLWRGWQLRHRRDHPGRRWTEHLRASHDPFGPGALTEEVLLSL